MDCDVIQKDLVPYHFGVIDAETRASVEEHLTTCPQCLRDFIALKREIETGNDERPSELAKARLRKAVMQELVKTKPRVAWSWWERPLAATLAGAAVFAAFFAVHAIATSTGSAPHAIVANVAGPTLQ